MSVRSFSTDFNTSHVTVYRLLTISSYHFFGISIHLMLLFIFIPKISASHVFIFQYISCYCLSETNDPLLISSPHFNTSHVTVYRNHIMYPYFLLPISIHLMLLFISSPALIASTLYYFNTSHVTVYLTS